jgi:MFS transporter, DHA3 family, multidrug efflux protein
LGRVIGFAHSIEQAASPVTAFLIGPIAHLVFIPFMTTGAGVDLIGDWYGTGVGRGIGLVFTTAGLIGLIVTIFAKRSRATKMLTERIIRTEPKLDDLSPPINGNDDVMTNGNIHSSSYVLGGEQK